MASRNQSDDLVLIGAGLPRTGTMSTRAALKQLLEGDVYHMDCIFDERQDHNKFWAKAALTRGAVSASEWRKTFEDYKGGVDYPVAFFYKELRSVYPHAKVLLNVRDPVKWYESQKNSIYRSSRTLNQWPCTWFLSIIGRRTTVTLVKNLSYLVPTSSSTGLSMLEAVAAGQDAAVQFYLDHVNEVKSVVPSDRLLVWEVKEGWAPLCKFLDVPVPNEPFPRINDTTEIESHRKLIQRMAWLVVVVAPVSLLTAACYCAFETPAPYYMMAAGYLGLLGLIRQIWAYRELKIQNSKKID